MTNTSYTMFIRVVHNFSEGFESCLVCYESRHHTGLISLLSNPFIV